MLSCLIHGNQTTKKATVHQVFAQGWHWSTGILVQNEKKRQKKHPNSVWKHRFSHDILCSLEDIETTGVSNHRPADLTDRL